MNLSRVRIDLSLFILPFCYWFPTAGTIIRDFKEALKSQASQFSFKKKMGGKNTTQEKLTVWLQYTGNRFPKVVFSTGLTVQ